MSFKTNKVWLSVSETGKPLVQNNKVLIKYQLDQDYEYKVFEKAVKPLSAMPAVAKKGKPRSKKKSAIKSQNIKENDPEKYKDAILIYTDGASSGNPGPSGIGVFLEFKEYSKEVSQYIGRATNNIAELKAIQKALSLVNNRSLPVRLFTDSSYALGLLTLGWKPRKNQVLVNDIKKQIKNFKDLQIIKIKGHAGHRGNEKADELATRAVKV